MGRSRGGLTARFMLSGTAMACPHGWHFYKVRPKIIDLPEGSSLV
jgi:hypothetical protein